jgi:hypothetical protein
MYGPLGLGLAWSFAPGFGERGWPFGPCLALIWSPLTFIPCSADHYVLMLRKLISPLLRRCAIAKAILLVASLLCRFAPYLLIVSPLCFASLRVLSLFQLCTCYVAALQIVTYARRYAPRILYCSCGRASHSMCIATFAALIPSYQVRM